SESKVARAALSIGLASTRRPERRRRPPYASWERVERVAGERVVLQCGGERFVEAFGGGHEAERAMGPGNAPGLALLRGDRSEGLGYLCRTLLVAGAHQRLDQLGSSVEVGVGHP